MLTRLRRLTERIAMHASRHAPTRHGFAVLGAISVLATWSMTIAVGPFLMAFCAAARTRWRAFTAVAAIATAAAAVVQVRALELWFAPWLAQQIAALTAAPAWAQLQAWLTQWGSLAMFAWLALPLPQLPLVLLAALLHAPSWLIFMAFVFGKGLKYAVEAYVASAGTHAVMQVARKRRG